MIGRVGRRYQWIVDVEVRRPLTVVDVSYCNSRLEIGRGCIIVTVAGACRPTDLNLADLIVRHSLRIMHSNLLVTVAYCGNNR